MTEYQENDIDFLWQSFLKGNDKCFSLIYQQSINGLLFYGFNFTSDRELLHDCIQDVFTNLFVKKKNLGDKIKSLKPYLFVSIRNEVIKRIVKENKYRFIPIEEINDSLDFNVEYSTEQKILKKETSTENNKKLIAAVNSLPPRQKEIVYLRFEEELEYSEIAVIMKISVESARKSMHRTIISLRNLLDPSSFQIFLLLMVKKIEKDVPVLMHIRSL